MTPEEKKEWDDFRVKRASELREILKKMEDGGIKDNKYWHLRIEHFLMVDPFNSLSSHYLGLMKICVECLTHFQGNLPMIKHWKECWGCFVMDTSGEARCALRYPYHPIYGPEVFGQEKKEWKEIIELWHQYHDLTMELYESICKN